MNHSSFVGHLNYLQIAFLEAKSLRDIIMHTTFPIFRIIDLENIFKNRIPEAKFEYFNGFYVSW